MDLFVGRETELHTALSLLLANNGGVLLEVVGVHGVGKSTFLERLTEEAKHHPNVQTFNIDMKRYGLGEGYRGDFGARASGAVLWETVTRSRELMEFFADQHHHAFDEFRQLATVNRTHAESAIAQVNITLGHRSTLHGNNIVSNVAMDSEAIKHNIRSLQAEIDHSFVVAWTEYTRRTLALITIDTFDLVADDEIGQWVFRIANQLPNTLIVIARTPTQYPPGAAPNNSIEIPLVFFNASEVAWYLQKRLNTTRLPGDLVDIAREFTDGHPGGVSLIADLIIEHRGAEIDPVLLRKMLSQLPPHSSQRWAELVELILKVANEPQLSRAVKAAAITNTFNTPLLGKLIGTPPDETSNIVSELLGLRLVQQIKTVGGQPSDHFRLHEFIRRSVATRLRAVNPEGWRQLHADAAQYYFDELVHDWDDGRYAGYGAWYRIEDPKWQEYKREWLRHDGMLSTPSQRSRVRARFTLLFLEVLWWWGSYTPFPFTRRLLEDWGRASSAWTDAQLTTPVELVQLSNEDEQLLEALTSLLNEPHTVPSDAMLNRQRDNYLLIRRLCTVRGGGHISQREHEERTRLEAFITAFLGFTARFRDPTDGVAEKYYLKADQIFTTLGDEWICACISYHRAALALERGDYTCSMTRLTEAAKRTKNIGACQNEWDHELLARIHRVRADIEWYRGDVLRSAEGYGRAVAHAYWFQGDPHPPDEYTREFYQEMTTRSAQRIVSLLGSEDQLDRFMSKLCDQLPAVSVDFSDRINEKDVDGVRRSIFLPDPPLNELGSQHSRYMIEWDLVHEEAYQDPNIWLDELIASVTDDD